MCARALMPDVKYETHLRVQQRRHIYRTPAEIKRRKKMSQTPEEKKVFFTLIYIVLGVIYWALTLIYVVFDTTPPENSKNNDTESYFKLNMFWKCQLRLFACGIGYFLLILAIKFCFIKVVW